MKKLYVVCFTLDFNTPLSTTANSTKLASLTSSNGFEYKVHSILRRSAAGAA